MARNDVNVWRPIAPPNFGEASNIYNNALNTGLIAGQTIKAGINDFLKAKQARQEANLYKEIAPLNYEQFNNYLNSLSANKTSLSPETYLKLAEIKNAKLNEDTNKFTYNTAVKKFNDEQQASDINARINHAYATHNYSALIKGLNDAKNFIQQTNVSNKAIDWLNAQDLLKQQEEINALRSRGTKVDPNAIYNQILGELYNSYDANNDKSLEQDKQYQIYARYAQQTGIPLSTLITGTQALAGKVYTDRDNANIKTFLNSIYSPLTAYYNRPQNVNLPEQELTRQVIQNNTVPVSEPVNNTSAIGKLIQTFNQVTNNKNNTNSSNTFNTVLSNKNKQIRKARENALNDAFMTNINNSNNLPVPADVNANRFPTSTDIGENVLSLQNPATSSLLMPVSPETLTNPLYVQATQHNLKQVADALKVSEEALRNQSYENASALLQFALKTKQEFPTNSKNDKVQQIIDPIKNITPDDVVYNLFNYYGDNLISDKENKAEVITDIISGLNETLADLPENDRQVFNNLDPRIKLTLVRQSLEQNSPWFSDPEYEFNSNLFTANLNSIKNNAYSNKSLEYILANNENINNITNKFNTVYDALNNYVTLVQQFNQSYQQIPNFMQTVGARKKLREIEEAQQQAYTLVNNFN